MSPASWSAARDAALRAIPVLIARGYLDHAAMLMARAKVFGERAGA